MQQVSVFHLVLLGVPNKVVSQQCKFAPNDMLIPLQQHILNIIAGAGLFTHWDRFSSYSIPTLKVRVSVRSIVVPPKHTCSMWPNNKHPKHGKTAL